MKKINLILIALFIISSVASAQESGQEDILTYSQLNENTKHKKYDEAYKYLKELLERNPKFNAGIYKHGEKILKDKIKKASGAQKTALVNELIKLWDDRTKYFPSKTPTGQYKAKVAQLIYDNNDLLNKKNQELYDNFDTAYKTDLKTFNNPQSLFTYFKLAVRLYDEGTYPAEKLFTKYDEVSEKVEAEIKRYTERLNKFNLEKGITADDESASDKLSSKDKQKLRSYNSYLAGYDKILKGMESDLGIRANCENLIPLFEKTYTENKNDVLWLQRTMDRLGSKDCLDSAFFVKLVEQKNNIEPDARTAYYLGLLRDKAGDSNGALTYYNQAISLEADNYEKAKILTKIASKFKKSGKYSQARSYYEKALKANPSLGKAHLAIAQMYAASANNCGDNVFEKKATYWLASREASKGARVDANIKSVVSKTIANWNALTPTKSEIFTAGMEGKTISYKCWIGRSVKVPSI